MKTQAALLYSTPGTFSVEEVELDPPQDNEVLVRFVATGLCHTDDHLQQGDFKAQHLPVCAGHEGAGVVEAVGPGVTTLTVGDHVVTSFIPGCGRCRWCASGMQNLCDNGSRFLQGAQLDGTFRMHTMRGEDVAQSGLISTFANHSVMPEWSCVRIPQHVPLESACLVGCAVPTGWGSAVNAGEVRPGHTVIVMGVGGVGANAVQGARHAGAAYILAVDPVEMKREYAENFGATHTFSHIDEAADFARSVTNGQGADVTIVTVGVTKAVHIGEAVRSIRKAGTVVVTGAGSTEGEIPVAPMDLVLFQKRIQGAVLGMCAPSRDVPALIELYERGLLQLDELVTTRYALSEINQGFDDMRAGKNIRGIVVYGQ